MNDLITINPDTDVITDVDVQDAFLRHGGLPVKGAEDAIDLIVRTNRLFGGNLVATLDRHRRGGVSWESSFVELPGYYRLTYEEVVTWTPENHKIAPHARFTLEELKAYLSIVRFQILWPEHAEEGTFESVLHPALAEFKFRIVQVKGLRACRDSYSGYRDNGGDPTGLADRMREEFPQARRVFHAGYVLDYCVGDTAIHCAEEGYESYVFEDATRSVDIPGANGEPGTVEIMRRKLAAAGVRVIQTSDVR